MNVLEVFDSLTFEDIRRMTSERQEEHLSLDFKTVGSSDLAQADDRRNFAIAIAGFANSDGGLIFRGIVARPDKSGVDCAQAFKPVDDLARFLGRLNELRP